MIVRLSAPTRLHFGLLVVPTAGIDSGEVRHFGGLGLMIDQPRIVVEARSAEKWSITGSLANRVERFRMILPPRSPLAIHSDGPPEHVGLGIGTALGMTLADIWSRFDGITDRPAHELAQLCGRGRRSGIGVHGYRHGGLVIDSGKCEGDAISPCESRPFPWPVVVLRPKTTGPEWSGDAEQRAFARPRSTESVLATHDRLVDLLHRVMLPALMTSDFETFTESLGCYNRIAGEPFADEQSGAYSSPEVERIIHQLSTWGFHGVGQSSWGPTVFAIVRSGADGESLLSRLNFDQFDSVQLTQSVSPSLGLRTDHLNV